MVALLRANFVRLLVGMVMGATAAIAAPASADDGPAPVPDIIGSCPASPPVKTQRGAGSLVHARRAASAYARTTLQWPSVDVVRAYRVGSGDTSHESLYRRQITRSCGSAVARASYGVDLSNPTSDSSTSSRAALVVARFPDGWRVWARFYN
jgi:hypothetical protein